MVCKIVFCSEFLDIPDNAEERGGKEGEEHRQLQSVMRFTQTKKKKENFIFKFYYPPIYLKIKRMKEKQFQRHGA